MRPLTVLVIDDDPDHRMILVTFLQHHGYRTLEAADGERGIQMARERRPGIILMDVRLPVLDGWSATERLKKDPRTADIPVIVLTAHALAQDRAQAAAVGADSFLPKPCAPSRVLEEVRRRTGSA